MEKPSVKLSKKSWHYKLQGFVLGADNVPTLFNLCPYFWLTIFCMFAFIPMVFVRWAQGVDKWYYDRFIVKRVLKWADNADNISMYCLYDNCIGTSQVPHYVPVGHKRVGKQTIIEAWSKNNNVEPWTPEFQELIKVARNEYWDKAYEVSKRKDAALAKRRVTFSKLDDALSNANDKVKSAASSIKPPKINWDFTNIIKWTKRVVGVIITLILSAAIIALVGVTAKGIIFIIANWSTAAFLEIITGIGIFAGGAGVFFAIYSLFGWLTRKVNKGELPWLGRLLRGFLKIVFYYPIIIPIYAIFYLFLWKIVAVGIIWSALVFIGTWFVGFTGIFGAYFGAAYTDYCPGMEMVD